MCDYSLESQLSRPAAVGDEIVTSSFKNSSTRGFCAVGAPEVAVCLMPGTELAFEKPIEVESFWSFAFGARLRRQYSVAIFRKVNQEKGSAHHDALEFPDGRTVLLTRLRKGQAARVIQLPANIYNHVREDDEHGHLRHGHEIEERIP